MVSGFLFDMWRIYEDFLCAALRDALAPIGGKAFLQYRTHLDEAQVVAMRPDFVWSRDGTPVIVADAKYKVEKFDRFPNADLYQLFAYCTVMGLPEGHLVYASGDERPTVHRISGTNVLIHTHALDLDQPPAGLLAQAGELGARMANVTAGNIHA